MKQKVVSRESKTMLKKKRFLGSQEVLIKRAENRASAKEMRTFQDADADKMN